MPKTASDRGMEIVLGNLLRIGVVIAAAVVLAGGILYLVRHGGQIPHYSQFRGQPAEAGSPAGIISMVESLQAQAVIRLGFLLLIATPVLRVAFSVVGYVRERDYRYVVITLTVLLILLYSLFWGGAG